MDLEVLKELVRNNEIDAIEKRMSLLSARSYEQTIGDLLFLLRGAKDGSERNTIAYLLGELECQEAAGLLMEWIFNPELKNNRGTLISALGKLDCKEYIYPLLPLLYEGNYEVVVNTHMLLQKHVGKLDMAERKRCLDFMREKIEGYEDILDCLYDVYENVFQESIP